MTSDIECVNALQHLNKNRCKVSNELISYIAGSFNFFNQVSTVLLGESEEKISS